MNLDVLETILYVSEKSLVDKTQKIQNIPEHPKSPQTKERDALNLFERIGEYIDECFQVVSKWFLGSLYDMLPYSPKIQKGSMLINADNPLRWYRKGY